MKLITENSIDECKQILSKIDQSVFFGEMKVDIKGNSLKLRRRVYNGYTRFFSGSFYGNGIETTLEGTFSNSKVPQFFHIVNIIVCAISFFFGLFIIINSNRKMAGISNIILSVFMFLFETILLKTAKKKGKDDERYIVQRLITLLNAKENIPNAKDKSIKK